MSAPPTYGQNRHAGALQVAVTDVKTAEALQAAVTDAKTAKPLPPAGEYAESWDGGKTFHWTSRRRDANGVLIDIPADSARVHAEVRAMMAVQAYDAACAALHTRPKSAACYRGVRVGWLKEFVRMMEGRFSKERARQMTTAEVVERIIKTDKQHQACVADRDLGSGP